VQFHASSWSPIHRFTQLTHGTSEATTPATQAQEKYTTISPKGLNFILKGKMIKV